MPAHSMPVQSPFQMIAKKCFLFHSVQVIVADVVVDIVAIVNTVVFAAVVIFATVVYDIFVIILGLIFIIIVVGGHRLSRLQ